MSINRRPLHFFSLMLLLLVAFALRQQSSSDEADSAVASVAPSSELAPEVHSVTVATDSLLLVREEGHEPLPVGQGGTLLRRVGYLTSSNIKYIDNQLVTVIKIQMICKCKYKTI